MTTIAALKNFFLLFFSLNRKTNRGEFWKTIAILSIIYFVLISFFPHDLTLTVGTLTIKVHLILQQIIPVILFFSLLIRRLNNVGIPILFNLFLVMIYLINRMANLYFVSVSNNPFNKVPMHGIYFTFIVNTILFLILLVLVLLPENHFSRKRSV